MTGSAATAVETQHCSVDRTLATRPPCLPSNDKIPPPREIHWSSAAKHRTSKHRIRRLGSGPGHGIGMLLADGSGGDQAIALQRDSLLEIGRTVPRAYSLHESTSR